MRRKRNSSVTAIIGAGPHGLAAAAHLRAAGVRTVSFGEPLEFWREHMPRGMRLRSRRLSSSISHPGRGLTIEHYEREAGRRLHEPNLLLEEFVDYGLWFQRKAVPELDRRKVTHVSRDRGAFRLRLSDGEEREVARVVVAAGLAGFRWRPPLLVELPAALVSHACDHRDLAIFAGKRVAVIGAGQSALECAALLSERGAAVELIARTPSVRWLPREPGRWCPPTDVGGPVDGWIAALPDLFRRLPHRLQRCVAGRCIRPAGSGWVQPRLHRVMLSRDRIVIAASVHDQGVQLVLDDGSERLVDHVLLGTGYRVDVKRYPFLAPELAAELDSIGGYPLLGPGLESSVAGLHFIGAPAAFSFGPLMRFVVGTRYAAPALTRRIAGAPQPLLRLAF